VFFFFQAEDGIRDRNVTGVQTCALPILKTKAVRDGQHWILNGVKRWISNAGESDYYTVMAVTDPAAGSKGISAFVVEKTDDGVRSEERRVGKEGSCRGGQQGRGRDETSE